MAGVTYAQQGRIASIQIDAGNVPRPELRKQLNNALLQYRNNDDAWMAVISTSGKDFSLGVQPEPSPTSNRGKRERALLWGGGYVEVWKPLIAAVQGQCSGEGLALVLGCDLAVAEEGTVFSADLSAAHDEPAVVPAWLLNLVGLSKALELLWLGRSLNAEEALRLRLVNRIAAKGPVK